MSAQDKLAAKIKALQQRSAAGDARAKAELQKLSQIITRYRQAMHAQQERQAADQLIALEEAEEGPDQIAGMPDEAVYTADKIDFADQMAAKTVYMDGLDSKAYQRQAEWNRLDQNAPFMRVNPPSALRGMLGNQATVSTGPSASPPDKNKQVALWEGEDAETTPITVTLGPVTGVGLTAEPYTAVPWLFPYAIVQFGTKGFATNFEVDIGVGCQFTLTASMVSLQVALEDPPTGFPSTNASLQLSGMLSFGPTNRQPCPITRTLVRQVTLVGGTVTVPVPNFAKRVWLITSDGTAVQPAIQIAFLTASGTQNYAYAAASGAPFTVPLIISNGTFQIGLTIPGGGVASLFATLVFELEF